MISIGDDYWIEDEAGVKAFRVNGKAVRARDTWVLEDAGGDEVAVIREKKLSIRDAIKIELASGREAVVKKEIVSIRDRFHVEVEHGEDLTAKGNLVDHEYMRSSATVTRSRRFPSGGFACGRPTASRFETTPTRPWCWPSPSRLMRSPRDDGPVWVGEQ